MSYRRTSFFAVLVAVIAAFVAPGSANAAPGPKTGSSGRAGWPADHLPEVAARAALREAHPTAAPRIPHLDPQLQAAPASPNSTIEVTLHGDPGSLATATASVGGRAIATVGHALTAVVPRSVLATLAAARGVSSVDKPVRAYPDTISEGIAASNASTWQSAGQHGAAVKVGIVDAGFANLSNEIAAGNLPGHPSLTNHCANVGNSPHGTAVAEIVHQMAPAATLVLYCIDDNIGFEQAEQQIADAGDIKIVNSSLSFPGDSRGDGSGGPDSTAATVQKAQQAGILWIESAGNNAQDHWSGTLQDTDSDGLADLNGTGCSDVACNESDGVFVEPGQPAELVLKWDQWPTVSQAVALTLYVSGWQCTDAECTDETPLNNDMVASQQANSPPVLGIDITNQSAFKQEWDVYVELGAGVPQVAYDLSYWGAVSQSYLASVNPSRAAAGSITEPADSPAAFAVGAVDVRNHNKLEPSSSQGPTIDGRVKPDMAGFDDVSSNLSDLNPFLGTSAAAPHVAGAAALVAGAYPDMPATSIVWLLEQDAGFGMPQSNKIGFGVLSLGTPPPFPRPFLTRLSASDGAVGATLTISGEAFAAGWTVVRFGDTESHNVTVLSATRLVASIPARALGTVDVTVTTPGGTSALATADRFTYRPLIAAAVDPRTSGYWLATPQGNVYQFGAPWYGSKAGVSLPAHVVGMAADPATGGYWLVTSKGNVYNFNAPFYGSMAGKTLPAPVVSITSSGHGYLLTTAKGNVYNFNAPFYGSMAGKTLPAPVVSITSSGHGYLLTTAKGNVYNFNAPFYGSMAGKTLPAPISGITRDPATGGYWLTTTKGNVYNFHAPWWGSWATTPLPAPVVTINHSGLGYVLTTSAGNIYPYHAAYHSSPADNG